MAFRKFRTCSVIRRGATGLAGADVKLTRVGHREKVLQRFEPERIQHQTILFGEPDAVGVEYRKRQEVIRRRLGRVEACRTE